MFIHNVPVTASPQLYSASTTEIGIQNISTEKNLESPIRRKIIIINMRSDGGESTANSEKERGGDDAPHSLLPFSCSLVFQRVKIHCVVNHWQSDRLLIRFYSICEQRQGTGGVLRAIASTSFSINNGARCHHSQIDNHNRCQLGEMNFSSNIFRDGVFSFLFSCIRGTWRDVGFNRCVFVFEKLILVRLVDCSARRHAAHRARRVGKS